MANYFLNDDGSLTKSNKKKKKGNNYILQDDGKIVLNSPTETTKKQSVSSLRDGAGTVNEDGYTYTGKNYGDYWYQNYATDKDNKIYSKDGNYFVYDGKNYRNVDQISFMTTKELSEKEYKEAKKMGFTGSKSTLSHVSEKLKLDTADLTSAEYTEYEKDLLRQQDARNKELAQNSQINYGGAGLKGAVGEIKTAFSNVANKVDKEIIAPIKNFSDNYETGKLNNQLALEYYKKMQGEENNADELRKKVDVYNSFNQDLLNDAGATGTAIQQLNTQVESIKNQGIAATILSGVGAIGGGLLTKSTKGAIAGAKIGGGIGYAFGSTPYMYKLEAGNQFKALTDMGVPDDIAKKYSKITGGVNAAIESGENVVDIFTFGAAGKTASISKEAVSDMIDEYGESQVKKWLKNKVGEETAETIVKGVKVAGVSYLQNIGSEALEESLQETTSITTERLATNEAGIEREATLKDDLGRILESGVSAAISTAFTSPLTSLGGAIVTNTVNSVETKLSSKKGKKITSGEINEVIRQNIEKENPNLTTQEVQQIQSEIFKELQKDGVEITDIQQSVENIDNQIVELEKQLETTENDAEYERISNQIRVLEEKANQLEQQDIAPVQKNAQKTENIVQNVQETTDIAPVKQNTIDYSAVKEEEILPYLEQENKGRMESITDKDAPIETTQEADYMPDTISVDKKSLNALSKNIKKELGLNKTQTTELESIIQEVSKSETATREDLYNTIQKRFSEQTIEHKNEELAEIKRDLRNRRIYVDDYLKSEFRDGFNKIRQQNFNKLKFTNDGTSVDSVYQELSEIYPAYFPNDINNAQDQLQRIVDVANEDVIDVENYVLPDETIQDVTDFVYDSINDYKLDQRVKMSEEARKTPIDESLIPPVQQELSDLTSEIKSMIKDTKKEIKSLKKEIKGVKTDINEALDGIAPIKQQTDENKNLTVKESNALKINNLEKSLEKYNNDAQSSIELFEELILEKKKQYSELNNKSTLKANNILQQINNLETRKDNIQVEYGRKMNNVQKRIDKMNSKEFKVAEQRMTKQQEYREQARNLIGDTSTWVDKKLGIQYQINTLKRNLRDIVRGADGKADITTADAIYEWTQGDYNKNEAKLKEEYNKIVNPYADMKLTNQEHVYTQMLGEFKYNPETTLTQETVDAYYNKHKNKIDVNKVNKAIESARQTYDSLFDRINEALRNQGMKELEYRRGYFPHFVEDKQSFIGRLFDWKIKNDQIPTDIAGLTELNNPERSWQSFNKHRESDITDYNFGKGLETYVRGALDWIYHIEDIQKRRALENEIRYSHSEKGVQEKIEAIYNNPDLDADEVQSQIDAIYKEAKNPLNNFVTDLRNSTNNLAGKKSSMDRGLEYATNRRIYSTVTNLSNRVSGNMIGGSISSALTNFIPITQSWGQVNPVSSLKGMLETIKSSVKDDGTIAKSTFLTNRLVKNEHLYKTGWDKAADKVAIMTDVIDSFTSQTIWRSKYNENIKNGMNEMEAIADADRFTENVMAGRSRGNEPTIFNSKNPLTRMFTAFQLEVNNQYQYMFKDMPIETGSKGKLIKGYTTMFVGAYLYNALYSSLVGRDVAFDPIGLIEDILKELGFGDDEEEKTASEKFTAISEDLVQQLPFVGGLFGGGRVPISAAIPYDNPIAMFTGTATDTLDAIAPIFSDDEDVKEKGEKALKDLTSEWLKPVTYLALPFGGGQIKKSIEGLSMYDDDLPIKGSYTNGGDLRFAVEDTPLNRFQSFLFGKWANKNAQEYIEKGYKPLGKNQIEEFLEMNIPYSEYREYRKDLTKINKTKADKDEDGKAISGTAAGKKAYQIMNGDYSKKEKERLLEGLSSETYKITTSDLNKLNNNEELYKYYFSLTTKGKSDFINAIKNYGFDAETLYEANTVIKNIEDNYSKLNDNGNNLTKQKKQAIKNAINQYTTTEAQYNYLYHKIYKK